MRARAKVVLPAPRSPESVTRSPPASALAMSIASRWVACSSGNATEKLDVVDVVCGSPMAAMISRRRALGPMVEREHAGNRGTAADRGFEPDRAAVQLHEGAHQRQPEPGAAVARAERMGLEPIEHLVLHIGRDTWSAVGYREHDGVLEPLGGEGDGLAGGGEAHCVGQEIEQGLAHAPLV